MTILYEGADLTGKIVVSECVYKDCSGRCDALTIELEDAGKWHNWKPETDDEIEVIDGVLSTGKMYLKSVKPQDGKYVLVCSSLPSAAEKTGWASYEVQTLSAIVSRCASECGFAWQVWGTDGGYTYPYLVRKNIGPAKFMEELAEREGAVLKCSGGVMRVIGVEEACAREPVCRIGINAEQAGVKYEKDETTIWESLSVVCGNNEITAIDVNHRNGKKTSVSLPAGNAVNAGRWARNLLMMHNRRAEKITMDAGINHAIRALSTVEITGGTEMDGIWFIDETEIDLIDRRSRTKMTRVVK